METVNNLATAASKAIWGEGKGTDEAQKDSTTAASSNTTAGTEPVAGQTGNVEAGEPYDKGNVEGPSDTPTNNTSTLTSNPKTTDAPGNTTSTGPIRSEHETDKTGVTSLHNPTSATASDKPTSSNDNTGPGAAPSVNADPATAPQETQKHQGADRPDETPSGTQSDRIKETKKEAEEAANVDTKASGPKTLEEKAKEGGGAAGKGEGDNDGPQKESHGEGTGEKYVKSSGMKADGGDFDAANPGAGREADRILETKGIHHETPGSSAPSKAESTSDTKGSSKPSLKEKIKAKLHKH